MPRRVRPTLVGVAERQRAHAVDQPMRVQWFEDECRDLVRQCRAAASYYVTRPDPFQVREHAKLTISLVGAMLRHVRDDPDLALRFWNAVKVGDTFQEMRFRNNAGEMVTSAKRQRAGAILGSKTSKKARTDQTRPRVNAVLLEAARVQRRGKTQRQFALTVAFQLNQKKPPPARPFTAEMVRAILRKEHFDR